MFTIFGYRLIFRPALPVTMTDNAEWKRESVDGVVVLANNAFQRN
ncbi:hypothetical protein MY3296_008042 [Beauveria thailandica]